MSNEPPRTGRPPFGSWRARDRRFALERPVVLGILNLTPDSFSDGGRWRDPGAALAHARRMCDEGADLVDVGGESTRPGAAAVDAAEEWRRIGTVVAALAAEAVPVSVDTTKPEVAARALDAGAVVVNDVSALSASPGIADLCARTGAGLVLMHMRGDPRTMQDDVSYGALVPEVARYLEGRAALARERGVPADGIVVDPGIGFGKSPEGNLELIAGCGTFAGLGYPVLVGPSRKSFIGELLGLPLRERLEGTLAACVAALERGARLFRVHDVAAVRRALDLAERIRRTTPSGTVPPVPAGMPGG
ncbi:MAG: dihydropteroate synthase [Gemmatimonadota bacterium]|nr:dihydropteroate synthase [Gemmatimonadota bacterium]